MSDIQRFFDIDAFVSGTLLHCHQALCSEHDKESFDLDDVETKCLALQACIDDVLFQNVDIDQYTPSPAVNKVVIIQILSELGTIMGDDVPQLLQALLKRLNIINH